MTRQDRRDSSRRWMQMTRPLQYRRMTAESATDDRHASVLVLIVTLGKSETYKETMKEKSTILPYSIHPSVLVLVRVQHCTVGVTYGSPRPGRYRIGQARYS